MGLLDRFRAAAPPPPNGPPLQSFPFGAPLQEYGSGLDALHGLDTAPKVTPSTAQHRLAAMLRGYDHQAGGLVSHGGVVTFVETVIGTMFDRMDLCIEINEEQQTRRTIEDDPEHSAIIAWLDVFRSSTQTHKGLLKRFLLYWRVFGETWVVRYTNPAGSLEYDVLPPYMVTVKEIQGRAFAEWKHGKQTRRIPLEQATHIVNDWLEPGVPHSPWFGVLDHLERIDSAFAALDRATASSLLMTKIVAIRKIDDAQTTIRPRAASPTKHATGPDETPLKQPNVPMPGEQPRQGNKPHKLATDLDNLGRKRTDPRYRHKPQLAAAQFYQGPYELDVVDPLVEIDEQLFEVIRTDIEIVARATTLPTNFVLSGFGEDNHWTAAMTREEVLDNTVMPTIQNALDAFNVHVLQPEIGRNRIITTEPERVTVSADPSTFRSVTMTVQEVALLRREGVLSMQGAKEILGLEDDHVLDLDDPQQAEQWAALQTAQPASRERIATPNTVTQPAQTRAAATDSLEDALDRMLTNPN